MEKIFYTTRTGIKIGSLYTPPLRSLNKDEERVQAVILGIEHDWSFRRTFWFAVYCSTVVTFVSILMAWVRT